MKEYQIEVTSVTTVYVEAESEDEAMTKAYEEALWAVADSNDAVVVDVTDGNDEMRFWPEV